MNSLFSIVIPTYNRASLISRAIESIIGQSYGNWELLIIDDGSTDETKKVVSDYNDSRIKYFYQENKGRSSARNVGVSYANSEWICFLDSDDEYLPTHLEVLHNTILRNKPYLVFRTEMMYKDHNGAEMATTSIELSNVKDPYHLCRSLSSVLHYCFHISIFNSHLFKEIEIWEDKDFLIRTLHEYDPNHLGITTVIAHDHSQRSVKTSHENYSEIQKTLYAIGETLNEVGYTNKSKIEGLFLYSILYNNVTKNRSFFSGMKLLKEANRMRPQYILRALYYYLKTLFL